MAPEQLTVTIAMPAYNEEHYIETCIASVQAQDYPRELIEILVADGRSTDKTRDILARLAHDDPRIKIIDNPERLQAAGLVKMVKAAAGDIVVRMDVHCEYASDYVRAVPDLVRTWVPRRYVTLGTDGFGRSDTREALRRFFEVDRGASVVAALKALADEERIAPSVVVGAVKRFGIDAESRNPWDA